MSTPQKSKPILNEKRDPKSLIPAKYNPRKISDDEKAKLVRSLKEFGQVMPILINPNNEIIGGHQTTAAAIEAGIQSVDVRVVDLGSEDKEKMLNLALNRISGEFDEGLLGKLIQELSEKDELDIMLSGFDSEEIDDILEAAKKALESNPDEDDDFDVEGELAAIKDPETRFGEVIRLGDHLLICGDSTDPDTYRKLLGQEHVDVIFTDPPYNVAYKSESKKLKSGGKASIENDSMSRADFSDFCDAFMRCFDAFLKPGGVFYLCTGWSSHPDFINSIRKLDPEWNVSGAMVWDKQQFTMGWQDYRFQYELIVYGFKTGAAHFFIDDRAQSDIWNDIPVRESNEMPAWAKDGKRVTGEIGKRPFAAIIENDRRIIIEIDGKTWIAVHENEKTDVWRIKRMSHTKMTHPTEKPVELVKRAILNSSKRGDIVLDAFAGSGPTLIAAESTGRQARLIELDPKFCDVIRKRWAKYQKETNE